MGRHQRVVNVERLTEEKGQENFKSMDIWYYYLSESVSLSAVSGRFAAPWTVSLVHGILQVRILERIAIPFSRGSSQARDRKHGPFTRVNC